MALGEKGPRQFCHQGIIIRHFTQRMAISKILLVQLLGRIATRPDTPTVIVDHIRDDQLAIDLLPSHFNFRKRGQSRIALG
jgi:hypothetical protein